MYDIDDALACFPSLQGATQRAALVAISAYLKKVLDSKAELSAGQLRRAEDGWRDRFDLDHPTLRLLILLARDMVGFGQSARFPALGPLRDHHPSASPLTARVLHLACEADQIERDYAAWRVNPASDELDATAEAGEILLLCLLRGGITLPADLLALVTAPLTTLSPWYAPENLASMSVKCHALPAEADVALERFRARHPKATSLLGTGPATAEGVRNLLAASLQLIPTKGAGHAANTVIQAARARIRCLAPDWLVQLMVNADRDVAAWPATRFRLLLDGPLFNDDAARASPTPADTNEPAPLPTPTSGHIWPSGAVGRKFLADTTAGLRKLSKQRGSQALMTYLDNVLDGEAPPPDTLTTLIVQSMRARLTRKRPPEAMSLVRSLSALQCLPMVAGLESPFLPLPDGTVLVDADVWERIMEKAVHPDNRTDDRTPRELARFHDELATRFPALAECDLEDINGMQIKNRTRAVFVTPAEFHRAHERMNQEEPDAFLMALLGSIGFSCGPRIKELTHARLRDLRVLDDRLILEIRHYTDRTLKTPDARRDLPLHVFLSAQQQEQLRLHAKALAALGHPPGDVYLFASLAQPRKPPTRECAVRIVHHLRAMTGDSHITFHSLRHSAVGWLSLQMLSHEFPAVGALPLPGVPRDWFDRQTVQRRLAALVPDADLAPPGMLPDDWTAALARLFGHASFATTLRHYWHLRYLIQSVLLDQLLPPLPRMVATVLSTLPDSAFRSRAANWRKTHDRCVRVAISYPLAFCLDGHQRANAKTRRALVRNVLSTGDHARKATACLPTWMVPVIIKLVGSGISLEEVCTALRCTAEQIAPIFEACRPQQREDGYLAALPQPRMPSVSQEKTHFIALAARLDAVDVDAATLDAWRYVRISGNRWIVPGQDDARRVLSHLYRVLPSAACVHVVLVPIVADGREGGPDERIKQWSTCCRDRWGKRLHVLAYSDGPDPLPQRPLPRGNGYMSEWAIIRVGFSGRPALGKTFARSQGLSEAILAWRVKGNLRAPLAARPHRRWGNPASIAGIPTPAQVAG